jgi:predicted transcriptional regulator
MLSLPDKFLKRVDRLAKKKSRSRSKLIQEALRAFFNGRTESSRSWKKALAPLMGLEQHWIGQWNSTDIIRYYRDTRYGGEDRR